MKIAVENGKICKDLWFNSFKGRIHYCCAFVEVPVRRDPLRWTIDMPVTSSILRITSGAATRPLAAAGWTGAKIPP